MFYLFFGQAYSRNYISVDTYNKLCVNKDTKIRMPKMKVDDEMDVVVFTKEEMAQLDEYFSGTNAETAYLLGKYCGLRINECFGLKWNNVNFDASQIVIDRQMQYQEGLIKLVPVKTRNGKRIVFMNEKLKVHLQTIASSSNNQPSPNGFYWYLRELVQHTANNSTVHHTIFHRSYKAAQ